MPTVFTEGPRAGEFIMSEAPGQRSRDNITIVSGAGVVLPGTVLGRISAALEASAAAKAGGNTGNGTFTLNGSTPVLAGAKLGVYTVRCVAAAANSGTFRVEDPDGNVIGDVVVGATFADDIMFVIADGATDFIVGDGFDVTVVADTDATNIGKYAPSPNTGTNGSQVAAAINIYEVDATSADAKVAAITRDAEVNVNCLNYAASVDDAPKRAAKSAQLANLGIITR